MGGYGSGRPREKTTTVEDCRILSVSDFNPEGALGDDKSFSGELIRTNRRTGNTSFYIEYEVDTRNRGEAWIQLHQWTGHNGSFVDYRIPLTTTPMPWGGVHWWFACPMCRRRCWKLYLPPGKRYFGCRTCHNLAYESSQEAHTFDGVYDLVAARMGVPLSVLKCAMRMFTRR